MRRIIIVLAVLMASLCLVHADELPVPQQIVRQGIVYKLNMDIVNSKGYAVYGFPNNISGNELKNGQYRYLGYDINGNLFSNKEFPDDADSGREDWEKDWIKYPWKETDKNGDVLTKKSMYNRDPRAARWLDSLNIGHGWTGEKLLDYFNIQSPAGDYFTGSARGWHESTGKIWYKTFVMDPEKKLTDSNQNSGIIIGYEPNTVISVNNNGIDERTTFWACSLPVSGKMFSDFDRESLPELQEEVRIQIDYYEVTKNTRKLIQTKQLTLTPELQTNYIDFKHRSTDGNTKFQAVFYVVSKHDKEPKLDWYGDKISLYDEYQERLNPVYQEFLIRDNGDVFWQDLVGKFYFYMKHTWDIYLHYYDVWSWEDNWFKEGFIQAITFYDDINLANKILENRPISPEKNFRLCNVYEYQNVYPRNKNNYSIDEFPIFYWPSETNRYYKTIKEHLNYALRLKELEFHPYLNLLDGLTQEQIKEFLYSDDFGNPNNDFERRREYLKKLGVTSPYLEIK